MRAQPTNRGQCLQTDLRSTKYLVFTHQTSHTTTVKMGRMGASKDLAKANELLNEARRLILEDKAQESLGLVDGALARVQRAIAALAERDGKPIDK